MVPIFNIESFKTTGARKSVPRFCHSLQKRLTFFCDVFQREYL